MSQNTHITAILTPEIRVAQTLNETDVNGPASVANLTKEKFEPVANNIGDSSKYFYEFGAQKTGFDKPMSLKIEVLNKRIAQKVTQKQNCIK